MPCMKWEMSGSKKTSQVHGRRRILVPLGRWRWGSSSTSQGHSPVSPGKGGKETTCCWTCTFLCPPSFQWQWQLSAFLHLLNWKEAIENSFDFQWQLVLAGHWRAKQANRKKNPNQTTTPASRNVFLPLLLFSSFPLEEQSVYESSENVNTGPADIQPRVPTRLLSTRRSSAGEGAVVGDLLVLVTLVRVSQNRRDRFQGPDKQTEPNSNAPRSRDGKAGEETTARATAKATSPASDRLKPGATASHPEVLRLLQRFSLQLEMQPGPRTRNLSAVCCWNSTA